MSDDVLRRLREEITAVDREIFAAVNHRLELVAELKRHKAEHGIDFLDPSRERDLVEERLRENEQRPLSAEGLKAFYAELLALTKRETA